MIVLENRYKIGTYIIIEEDTCQTMKKKEEEKNGKYI